MRFFAQATEPSRPASRTVWLVSLMTAAVLSAMAVAQLFTFERFPAVLSGNPSLDSYAAFSLLAALLVTVEVLAVPYLVMMRLSPLMRYVSMACGWAASLAWFEIGVYSLATGDSIANNGVLGASIPVPSGWVPAAIGVCLAAGLWVTRSVRQRKRTKAQKR